MVEHGFYIDALSCKIKWHNLKKVYLYNKTHAIKKDGTKRIIVWDYYCDMDRAIKGIPFDISGKIIEICIFDISFYIIYLFIQTLMTTMLRNVQKINMFLL